MLFIVSQGLTSTARNLVKDHELRHVEIEKAGETQSYKVADDRLEGSALEPVQGNKQEMQGLHCNELQNESTYTGGVVAGEMPPERPAAAVSNPLLPDEEIRYEEIRHGGKSACCDMHIR